MFRSARFLASASSSSSLRLLRTSTAINVHVHVHQQRTWFSAVPINELSFGNTNSTNGTNGNTPPAADDATAANPDPTPPKRLVKNPMPDFSDSRAAYRAQSTSELIRAGVCFRLCQIPLLVNNAELLLNTSRKILGGTITDAVLRATLFGHFCAGEDEKKIQPVLKKLEASGIGSILDYAAENEGELDTTVKPPTNVAALRRVRAYDYESEAQCDQHVITFKKCINHVAESGAKDGYAAIKVTALGNPKLLARMSQAIIEAKRLFTLFDANNDGWVTRDEFKEAYRTYFNVDDPELDRLVNQLDPDGVDRVDYITWSLLLSPHDLPKITSNCLQPGPLSMATPTEEEVELIEAMYNRAYELAEEASKVGTRLLIDAEQTKFQPAIDNLVLDLQRMYNAKDKADKPIIYNTYQCYLKDSTERLRLDYERSERYKYHFGAKLVRGAYMETERREAEMLGFESPINDTIEDTHECYDSSVRFLLKKSASSSNRVELMCATHNGDSIEKAVKVLNEHGIDRKDSALCFAQLYGMSDNLSFNLGKHEYRVYKYLPYGQVHEVMPYLLRRARENSAIVGGAKIELEMIKAELKRRLKPTSAAVES